MPQPPAPTLFTRFVLENPWPLGFLLLAAAVTVCWLALRDGLTRRLWIAAGLAGLGVVVLVTGKIVVTSAEQGKIIVRDFVTAVVEEDLTGSMALLADDIRFSVGSLNNPGRDSDFVLDAFSRLARNYDLNGNTITFLRGYANSSIRAEMHLSCFTDVEQGYGPTRSRWILRVEKVEDQWKITRLCCLSINGQKPSSSLW